MINNTLSPNNKCSNPLSVDYCNITDGYDLIRLNNITDESGIKLIFPQMPMESIKKFVNPFPVTLWRDKGYYQISKYISRYSKLSESFIRKYRDTLDWEAISSNQVLSESFIEEFELQVNWKEICINQVLSEPFMRRLKAFINWSEISEYQNLSESFIIEFRNKVNWEAISIYQALSEPFIEEFSNWVDWYKIAKCQNVSKEFIEKHRDLIDPLYFLETCDLNGDCEYIEENKNTIGWNYIWRYRKVSEDFIRKYKEYVSEDGWKLISSCQKLSEPFIEEFKDFVNWKEICINQVLSEPFMRRFENYIDWKESAIYQILSDTFIEEMIGHFNNLYGVSYFQCLSEGFILRHFDKLNKRGLLSRQNLSEDFINKHFHTIDRLDIPYILENRQMPERFLRMLLSEEMFVLDVSSNQELSESLIREFKDKVDWKCIFNYQNLSEEFIEEFKDRIPDNKLISNWRYRTTSFKKKAVMNTNLYECHKDYFIAYKSIRHDRYSVYNFQYKYLPGETYTTWADYSSNENSFGFGVGTKTYAEFYAGGDDKRIIVKCKVYYKDVAHIVCGGEKIRCTKITILE